jgi:hypothetical protein
VAREADFLGIVDRFSSAAGPRNPKSKPERSPNAAAFIPPRGFGFGFGIHFYGAL